jgi:hypothetical protein
MRQAKFPSTLKDGCPIIVDSAKKNDFTNLL